jgi:hypothetical protein
MLVNAGYDTVAITRKMTQPYEDAPAWHTVKRELLDRENDPDFIRKLKAMEPDIIVDLVNFNSQRDEKNSGGISEQQTVPLFVLLILLGAGDGGDNSI